MTKSGVHLLSLTELGCGLFERPSYAVCVKLLFQKFRPVKQRPKVAVVTVTGIFIIHKITQ